MTLNERLNEIMEEKYLSAEALGRNIGLSGSMVLRWRRKNSALKLEHLLKLAAYFDCSVDFLCGRTENEGHFNNAIVPIFPERLRLLIEQSEKPIDRISKESSLDRHNFYDWFNGMQPLSSSLIILANYFDCSVDYLIGLEN